MWAAEPKAGELLNKIPQDRPVMVRVLRNRSAQQNALYWRCLEGVVEATGRWRTAEELHTALKVAVGYVDVVQLLDGRRVLVPKSTRFDQLTQDEFQEFMDAALRILCLEVMGGCSIDELLQQTTRAAA